jgi:hypothetical protein
LLRKTKMLVRPSKDHELVVCYSIDYVLHDQYFKNPFRFPFQCLNFGQIIKIDQKCRMVKM